SYLLLLLFFIVEYVRPTSYAPGLMAFKMNSLIPVFAFVVSLGSGASAAAGAWAWPDRNTRVVVAMLSLIAVSVVTSNVRTFAFEKFVAETGFAIIFWVMLSELTTIARVNGMIAALIGVHVLIAALNPILFTSPDERNYIASGSFLGDGNDF